MTRFLRVRVNSTRTGPLGWPKTWKLPNAGCISAQLLGIDDLGPEFEDNLSLYDLRTRNMNFASPEQLDLNNELASIVMKKNGKIPLRRMA